MGKFKSAIEDLKDAMGSKQWMLLLWIVVGAAVVLLLGYLVKRLVMVLCCSIVGAAMVIGGVMALLLAKQTEVVSNLQDLLLSDADDFCDHGSICGTGPASVGWIEENSEITQ